MNNFCDAFISYGRADSKAFATKLHARLIEQGLRIWFDQNDIPLGVDFQNQIDDGIEKADNFLFIIAPHSINSPYCGKEIELAFKRHKRIIPLLHVEQISRDTWQQRYPNGTDEEWEAYKAKGLHSSFPNMHPGIGKINWVYFREGVDDFDKSLEGLLSIIARHKDYVHKHTFFLAKALEWERNQKLSRYLLVGEERQEAQEWLKVRFKGEQAPCTPTDLHCEYITESIKNGQNLMTQVFLAYAYEDKEVMEKIRNSLRRDSITVWTNTTDIQKGEAYDKAVRRGIEQADNVVYLLSPEALKSEFCEQELNYALSLNKRLVPLLVKHISKKEIPESLRYVQYIDLTDNVNASDYLLDESELLKIFHQDEAYYNEHKMLLTKALKWKQQNDNPSILLRGYNLRSAEAWLKVANKRVLNPPTPLMEEFINESLRQPPLTSLDVFVSYSRSDSDFARKLNDGLQMQGKTTWFDQESIASGTDFQQEIYRGIEISDNFLFIISPRSINSPYCADEVEYAAKLNKRFVTLLYQPVNPAELHPELAKIQWIDFHQKSTNFATTFGELIRTLDTDRDHVHNHTKWSQRTLEWEEKGKNSDLLLRGSEFILAQDWLKTALEEKKQPPPTALQEEFIEESQKAIVAAEEAEKQRQAELVRLQAEKLKEAEARLIEEKKSAKRQKMFLAAVSVGFVIATALGVISFFLFNQATRKELQANIATAQALADYSDALFLSHKRLDALLEALKANQVLHKIKKPEPELKQKVESVLQQAVFASRQFNRFSGTNGHKATVLAVAVSPDGKIVASGSEDNTIKLWNQDGKLLKTLTDHKGSVNYLAFSPDGKQMASASVDETIKLWKPDGTLLKTLTGHNSKVEAVAFSPDSQTLASASNGKTVKLWKSDGTLLKTLTGHTEAVKAVIFSPDGKLIASAGNDRTIKLWKSDGTLLKTLTGNTDELNAIAFSPDGKWIASASDDGTIKLWKADGTLVNTFTGHNGSVTAVAFSPDSKTIASSGGDRSIKLWNLNGQLLISLLGHSDRVRNVVFTPNGKTVISGSEDNTVRLWRRETPFLNILIGHQKSVNAVAFSPDKDKKKQLIASASEDGTLRLWQPDGTLKKIVRETDHVNDVAFSPDGQTIVTGSRDKKITLWNPDGIRLQKPFLDEDKVNRVLFSPDGQIIASASDDNTAKLWRRDGTRLKVLKGHTDKVETLAFSPDGKLIATGSADHTIKLWNQDGVQLSSVTAHKGAVNHLAFSPNGKQLLSGSVDNTVKLWKLDGVKLIFVDSKERDESVNAVAFSPDNKLIAVASADKTILIWPLNGSRPPIPFYVHSDGVNDVAFSPNNRTVASASSDNTVILWDIEKVKQSDKQLEIEGCKLLRDYLQTSTSVDNETRQICKNIDSGK
ncbi:TIR domain-containing protein [Floridanema evergladense]|uniref:TIR domain-containing protein n=1 Tax=Floridaenema evergladense BLCC-F167 TaxID=3153639 RepID=A0ABV4WPN9_9CYAN